MGTSIKCWSVSQGTPPREAKLGAPDLEEHLEDWVEECVKLVDPSLLIIGRQIENIDLLAIDDEGQLVIIELKRDQLPRLVLAQALDYASMVAAWTPEKVIAIANEYLSKSGKSIHDAFEERFEKSLEDTGGINSDQRVVLVGCRTDSTLERMVNWLSEREIPINVVTLSFFALPDGQNILVRTSLVSEEEVKARRAAKRGRRPPMSEDEVRNVISELGLQKFQDSFKILDQSTRLTRTLGLDGIDYEVRIPRPERAPLRRKAVQILLRFSRPGQLRIGIHPHNLAQMLNVEQDEVLKALPNVKWHGMWRKESDFGSIQQCHKLFECIVQLLEQSQASKD